MKNVKSNQGIDPGTRGELTFYIISRKDGPLSVTLDLALTGYNGNENAADSTAITEIDDAAQQLLEGHLLLFAGYDSEANSYRGWISEDAEPWTISLSDDEDNGISLSREENGKLVWSVENAKKDTAYPVTLYWIWPERLESYLMKADTYTGTRPLLFPEDQDQNTADNAPEVLPENLFTTMCSAGDESAKSNRYFYWGDDKTAFDGTVTFNVLSQLRTNFNPVIYSSVYTYYNLADQYLGENVRFVKLKLDAV